MSTSTLHPMSRFLPKRPEGPMRSPARLLGWFSIGLGLAELTMPRALARVSGLPDRPGLVRAYGLREIGVGIGLLASRDPAPWLWGRVAGDALDAATLGLGMAAPSGRPLRALASLAVIAGITALDAQTARHALPKPARRSVRDYSDRSGFPKPAAAMRGAARQRTPEGGDGAGRAGSDGQAGRFAPASTSGRLDPLAATSSSAA